MWNLTGRTRLECEAVRDTLERTTTPQATDHLLHGPPVEPIPALTLNQRQHLNQCEECRIYADELLEVRGMLLGKTDGPQPGPYFMARVMASIADREVQLEKESQTWAAVPRLAYRLSVLASLLVLIAGSWLYQQPVQPASVSVIGSQQHSEGLVDGGAPMQDDLLVNLADR